jgi:hypothetical protein
VKWTTSGSAAIDGEDDWAASSTVDPSAGELIVTLPEPANAAPGRITETMARIETPAADRLSRHVPLLRDERRIPLSSWPKRSVDGISIGYPVRFPE